MVLGCFVRYPDASLIEVLGYLGWDFLVFDGEHGTLEPRDCENLCRAAELRGVTLDRARNDESRPNHLEVSGYRSSRSVDPMDQLGGRG